MFFTLKRTGAILFAVASVGLAAGVLYVSTSADTGSLAVQPAQGPFRMIAVLPAETPAVLDRSALEAGGFQVYDTLAVLQTISPADADIVVVDAAAVDSAAARERLAALYAGGVALGFVNVPMNDALAFLPPYESDSHPPGWTPPVWSDLSSVFPATIAFSVAGASVAGAECRHEVYTELLNTPQLTGMAARFAAGCDPAGADASATQGDGAAAQ